VSENRYHCNHIQPFELRVITVKSWNLLEH
jgi:hypothetical protein